MDRKVLAAKAARIEEIIYQALPKTEGSNALLCEAVNYSVRAGGKRLRPMLIMETYLALGGQEGGESWEMTKLFMGAMEFIHTYSLVHDDLPAMDNDELRRGVPTTHAKYGEAFGVLTGDALLGLAFEIVLQGMNGLQDKEVIKRSIRALHLLAAKAGIHGMVGGQSRDVYVEKNPGTDNTRDEIIYIYKNKTGALLEASMMTGAILAGAGDEIVSLAGEIAANVGMAFQIRDDILDVTSTTDAMGKPAGSDEKNNKSTYISLRGLEVAQRDVEEYSRVAMSLLDKLPGNTEFLRELTEYLIEREN
ncbi:MAG: polyprenyl synthetase family protein [Lachnospiraceae bacterium]|jgi:geranylgeranyl diphosphate synthase type II